MTDNGRPARPESARWSESTGIGRLNESPLHADLKCWYAKPGDLFELVVDGFVIDIVRGDLLIEIQTANFSSLRDKLQRLVQDHPVRLVYPIAQQKWLLKQPKDGKGRPQRRKSPKRGSIEDLFAELVSFPHLLLEPNFSLEVILIQEEEVRRHDERRAWRRRGWVTVERRLLAAVERQRFESARDLASLLPDGLPVRFVTADLAQELGKPRWLAQKMAYCLRRVGMISEVGRQGRSILYVRSEGA